MRQQKKGVKGAAANFTTRNQALKRLQLKLADFRRLCILKGIYPREPRNRRKVSGGSSAPHTYYWVKDIAFLAHEPLLRKFREYKAFARKLRRALGKHQLSVARSLEQNNKPTYTLDHIIKERYPSFVDAVRDLDDALCLLSLFARMPQTNIIQADTVQRCARLVAEFQHYVVVTQSLQKVFLSIKGIYYQATIMGQPVTWIAPYPFAQQTPTDVDYRVMLTFLELYETLLGFVNFKLYHDENLAYPPILDAHDQGAAAQKPARHTPQNTERLKSLPAKIASLTRRANGDDQPDEDEDAGKAAEQQQQQQAAAGDVAEVPRDASDDQQPQQQQHSIFQGLVFFLNREVPRESLDFVIRSFGGRIAEDETAEHITHHIVDRPVTERHASRDYVQPQWVYDSINARKLASADKYAPDAKLPPHLSPFVPADAVPEEPEVDGAEAEDGQDAGEHADKDEDAQIEDEIDSSDMEGEDEDERQHRKELAAETSGKRFSDYEQQQPKPKRKRTKGDVTFSSSSATSSTAAAATTAAAPEHNEEQDAKQLAKIMMTKRDQRLYYKIEQTKKRREERARVLAERRKALKESS